MPIDRKTFFDGMRELFGSFQQSQVDGLNFLLGKFETDSIWLNRQQIAYALATIDHETAHTFQPIKEFRARAGTAGRKNQDRYWLTGYYGRGYVQLTWQKNYEKFGIADDPEKALEPETAYKVLADGMIAGLFTGRSLGEFVNQHEADYVNARRVINGTDKASQIARAAGKFEAILKTAQGDEKIHFPAPESPKHEPPPIQPEPPPAPQAEKPEVTVVGKPGTSIVTKIGAAASAAGPVIAATGLKIGGVEFKTGGLIAFAAVLIVGMVIAAYLWNEAQKRRHDELKLSMEHLASPDKANVIAAGSKV